MFATRSVPDDVREKVQSTIDRLSALGYSITSAYWRDDFLIFQLRGPVRMVANVTLWNDDTITVYPPWLTETVQ